MPFETQPLAFSGIAALLTVPLHNNHRDSCVLFAGAFGYEDLCSRKMQRILAEDLASRGFASMRFDYIGTGDSLDADDRQSDAIWSGDLHRAAIALKATSGANRLIVVAQGLGSMIAAQSTRDGLGVCAIAHLAPVLSGKSYLRELSMWSTLIDDGLGLPVSDRMSLPGSIAGLVMPKEMVKWLSGAKLHELMPPLALPTFIAYRPERVGERRFADDLMENGAKVRTVAFDGYDALMLSPTQSKVPHTICSSLVEWIVDEAGSAPAPFEPRSIAFDQSHICGHFRENLARFGVNSSLIGTQTLPIQGAIKATVVFNSSGYDRRSGWGRQVAWLARQLAKNGVASLRYDGANVGDSAPTWGSPEEVVYHDSQFDDAKAAVDLVHAQCEAPIVMAGRCSGAYLALRAAERDLRIGAVVSVNPVVFYWEKGRSLDDALLMRPRTLGEYGTRLFSLAIIGRVLRGEVNVGAALRNLVTSLMSRYQARKARSRRAGSENGISVFTMFDRLQQRNVPIQMVFSEHDAGVENLDLYFEDFAAAHARYPNLTIELLPDTDHNLSSHSAREAYLHALLTTVQSVQK